MISKLFYPDERQRCFLRDKIQILEDIKTRDVFYRKEIGPEWDESFHEIKVRNWMDEERYLRISFAGEFMMFISRYSQLEIMEMEDYDESTHDLVFSLNDDSFPGCTTASRYTPEYAVLSEAWSTPYFELFRKLLNAYREEPKFRVITLCGSTRFKDEFITVQKRLTLEGNIVISVGLFGHSGDNEVWTPGTKEMLDEMHKRKIDMANEIFVINKGGYIGSSTRSEIEFAEATGKAVRYLEPDNR